MNKNNSPQVPTTNKALLLLAGILLLIPIVALLWVGSFAKVEPVFLGFPFFIWYQFLWVLLCPACTWASFVLVRRARAPRKENP
jgi:membrane protein implicated in regulation of membrane protease activity